MQTSRAADLLKTSGFLRSGAIYAAANVLAAGVPFLLLPILTRALSPAQYGEVISFYMLVAVSASVAGLSLQAAVGVRWLDPSQGDPKEYTASAMLLVALTTAVAAALAAATAPWFGISLTPAACAMAAVLAGANVVQGIRFAVWQSREQPLPAAALQVVSAALNVVLSVLAVLVLHWGGIGRIAGAVTAGVIVAAGCIVLLWHGQAATHCRTADLKSLLRFGLPLAPHALAGALLANADRFAVSSELGTSALGIYGTAAQLGMVINVLADATTKAFSPKMYRLLSRNTTLTRLQLVGFAYLTVPIWLMTAGILWAVYSSVGAFVLGASYVEAIDLSIWFLLGGAVGGVYLTIAGLFFFTGKTEWISLATVMASLFALLVAPYAVSMAGTTGGGLTYLAAQLAMLICAWALSRRIHPMPWGHPALALRVLWRRSGWRA